MGDKIDIKEELKDAFRSEEAWLKWFAEAVISKRPYKCKIPEAATEWERIDEALSAWREITSARGAVKQFKIQL